MKAGLRESVLSYTVKVLACFVLVFGIFGIVSLRAEIRSVEYQLGGLEKDLRDVLKERKNLMGQRAALLSINTVEQRAGETLGLDFPDRSKVFYVKRDKGDIPYEASLRNQ